MSLLRRLFGGGRGGGRAAPAAFTAPLAPDAPFYAIGDVHGRADLLERLLARIAAEEPEAQVVCVGDYIDRGEASREVLDLLRARGDIVCLAGNHEHMCLKFLAEPEGQSERWLRYGGLQTLASYGIGAGGQAPAETRDALVAAMGADTIAWLQGLPTWWQSGNVAVVHAGADPLLPLDMQAPGTLKWGHPDFDKAARTDGLWVVHGHTIVEEARADRGRIALDTGAYATGRLTAARIAPGEARFLTA